MRLYELIDFEPKNTKRDLNKHLQNVQSKTSAKEIGSGSFSSVFATDSPKRANQVTKVAKAGNISDLSGSVENIEDDGYLMYLMQVNKFTKLGANNPYFPVIVDLRISRAPDKKLHYRANLEKLTEFDSLEILDNTEAMKAVCIQMFGTWTRATGRMMAKYIEEKVEAGLQNPSKIKDPNLQRVLKLVAHIADQNTNLETDVSAQNMMWRTSGELPQLVIVDPVA
jgi:hypothetical protein